MADLRLVELSAATIVAVNNLSLKPGQEQFLAPVSYGIAATVVNPQTTWQRVVLDGDEVVAFVSANFDPDSPVEHFRSVLWRINVDADDQGRGVGRFAVKNLIDEAIIVDEIAATPPVIGVAETKTAPTSLRRVICRRVTPRRCPRPPARAIRRASD